MANNPHLAIESRKLGLDAEFDVLNGGGFYDVYDGTQPATPDTAITSQVRLVRMTLSSTAFAAAAGTAGNPATKTANVIGSATISATGAASWASLVKPDGTTRVQDMSVGTSSADAIVNSTAFQSGAQCQCSSLVESIAA